MILMGQASKRKHHQGHENSINEIPQFHLRNPLNSPRHAFEIRTVYPTYTGQFLSTVLDVSRSGPPNPADRT